MALPDQTGHTDEQLVQYLLGLLPPEEAERLDEASIVDDDVAARVRGVEDDLVDAYVRGALAGQRLARFESYYLASPRRREQVAFAGRFLPAVDRAASAGEGRPGPKGSRLVLTLAVAAALSVIAGGSLLLQTVRLKHGLSVAESERADVDRHARELEQQVAQLRGANASAALELERAREAEHARRGVPAIALVLLPQTRSIGPMPTLAIPPATSRLGFELRLESDDFPLYQVGLRDPAVNSVVWRSDWIAARSPGGQPSVRIAVPASVLKPQHYSLDLSGRQPAGEPEVMGSYAFEIVPR